MRREDNLPAELRKNISKRSKDLEPIQQCIHMVRGEQVMLDRDLARFYDVKAIRLREQVKRNSKRFPADFMFQLSDEEVELMVSQNAIPSKKHLGGTRPYVFTEQGIAAVSSILTSDRAIEVSILIMRAFVEMRRFLISNAGLFQRVGSLEIKLLETDKKIDDVLKALENNEVRPKQGVFFNGQVFDAHVLVSDIFSSAEVSIVVIDNYIDESVLVHLTRKKKGVNVRVYTKRITRALRQSVEKFNKQYPSSLELAEFKDAHDRFIIIDGKDVYHFGASLKDLGKKWFAFSKMEIGAAKMLARLGGGG